MCVVFIVFSVAHAGLLPFNPHVQGVGALGNGISGEHARATRAVAQSHHGGVKVQVDVLGIFLKVAVVSAMTVWILVLWRRLKQKGAK